MSDRLDILRSGREIPLVMGILNVTRDSLSDGGLYLNPKDALARAVEMVSEGADIIDIGAESTRPGAVAISAEEELSALIPVLRSIRAKLPKTPISVDTYKPEVAEAALSEGADILNDVLLKTSSKGECEMLSLAARAGCPIVAMHNSRERTYGDFWTEFLKECGDIIKLSDSCGVDRKNIFLDPGIGFGKTADQNFEIIRRIRELGEFGVPILLGVSRKSALVSEVGKDIVLRDYATSAVSVYSALSGAVSILRVHNVSGNVAALKVIKRILS